MTVQDASRGSGRVYVVIVNYGGWRDTAACVESVLRSDHPAFQVVVCDNGSPDGSLGRLAAWAAGRELVPAPTGDVLAPLYEPPAARPLDFTVLNRMAAERGGDRDAEHARLVLVDVGENLGFAGGCNVGIRYALARVDAGFVWLLNNDTVVEPGAMRAMVERLRARPDAGQCGSRIHYYHAPDAVQYAGGIRYNRWFSLVRPIGRGVAAPAAEAVERRMDAVAGASLMATRAFIEAVGLLHEEYFLYFEELDWATRARGRFRMVYAPDSVVYHREGRSIGSSDDPSRRSDTSDYYAMRNRLCFTRRFFPAQVPTVYLALMGAVVRRLRRGERARAARLLRVLAPFGADRACGERAGRPARDRHRSPHTLSAEPPA